MAEKLGQPLYLWVASYYDASLALLHGDTEEAEQLATAALEVGTAGGQPDAFAFYGVQLMQTRYEQGRMGELVSLIADAAEQNPSMPTFRAALGGGTPRCGRRGGSPGAGGRGCGGFVLLARDSGWFDGMVNYARVVIELQLRAHAEPLIERLAPFRDQVPHNGLVPQPPVATYLGGLATVARPLTRTPSRTSSRQPSSMPVARCGSRRPYTNMLWGRMLRTRNGPGDADRARHAPRAGTGERRRPRLRHGGASGKRRVVETVLIPTDIREDRPTFCADRTDRNCRIPDPPP